MNLDEQKNTIEIEHISINLQKKQHPLGLALGGSFLCQAFQIQPGAAANQHGGHGFFMVTISLIITTTMLGYKQWSTFGNNMFFFSLVIVISMYKQKKQ